MIVFTLTSLIDPPKTLEETALVKLDDETIEVLEALLTEHELYVVEKINYRIIDTILINSGLSKINLMGDQQIFDIESAYQTLKDFTDEEIHCVGTTQADIDNATKAGFPIIILPSSESGLFSEEGYFKAENLTDIIEAL